MENNIKLVNSVEDLKGLKKYTLIQYTCRKCGKDTVKQYTKNRIKTISTFLCGTCNRKQTMIARYGAATTLQSPILRNKVKKSLKKRYGVYHPSKSKEIQDKIKQTNLRKYGCENPGGNEAIKNKIAKTNLAKHGVRCTLLVPEIKEKAIQSMIDRHGVPYSGMSKELFEKTKVTKKKLYGDEHYANREKALQTKKRLYGDENYRNPEKCEQTNRRRYGVKSTLSLPDVQEKIKQTMLAKYGVEHSTQNKDIYAKVKATNKAKYGVEYLMQSDEIKERSKCSMLNKYGVENYTQTKEAQRNRNRKYYYDGEKFDSSWELALWIYAKDHGEQIEFADTYFEYTSDGKLHRYYPDFKYKGELIEIKGSQFRNDETLINPYDSSQNGTYDAKYKCAIDNGVKFMFEKDIQFAIEYARNKFKGGHQWYNQFTTNSLPQFHLTPPPLLPFMPMYIYPTIPMMLPWWMFMTPCDFTPFSNNVFEREGMEFVDCECEYE